MNTSHAVCETYGDEKSDNEQLSCDGTIDFQSTSPGYYQYKSLHTTRTTERGILTILLCSILLSCTIFQM